MDVTDGPQLGEKLALMENATVKQAAAHFRVSQETIRRWIREGAPCVSPGEVGRGHGALLDLDAVASWRASRLGVSQAGGDPMEKVAMALVDVLRRDGGRGIPIHRELGVSDDAAIKILTHAQSRIERALGKSGTDV